MRSESGVRRVKPAQQGRVEDGGQRSQSWVGGEEISGGGSGGRQCPGWGWLGECRGGEGCWC